MNKLPVILLLVFAFQARAAIHSSGSFVTASGSKQVGGVEIHDLVAADAPRHQQSRNYVAQSGWAAMRLLVVVELGGNRPPIGAADQVSRPIGLLPFKIRIAALLANDFDPDGDALEFAGLTTGTSERGRAVEQLEGGWLVYYPGVADEPLDDRFVYRVRDGRDALSAAWVQVREKVIDRPGMNVVGVRDAGGPHQIVFIRGIPGRRYQVQTTTELNPPVTQWTDLGAPIVASPQNGSFQVTNAAPGAAAVFYRTIERPDTGGGE